MPRRRRGRGRFALTARGFWTLAVGAVLVAAGALLARVELTLLGVVLWAVVVLGSVAVLAVPAPAAATRRLGSGRVTAGESLTVTTTMHGGSTAFVSGAQDAVSSGLERGSTTDDAHRSVTVSVTAARRGVHAVGPLRVDLLSPFQVARRSVRLGGRDEVIAVPPVAALAPLRAAARADGESSRTQARSWQGEEDLIPRPAGPGDSIRRVHWRASAHHGRLMVRDEEPEAGLTAIVMLDLAHGSWGDRAAFDVAVSACASVAAVLAGAGFAVSVADLHGEEIAELRSAADLPALLTACARIERRRDATASDAPVAAADAVIAIGRLPGMPVRATTRVLLASDGAQEGAAAQGWRAAELTADVARSWAAVIDGRGA